MAINHTKVEYVYGVGQALIPLPPDPVIAERDPSIADVAKLGTMWVNKASQSPFWLVGTTAGESIWVGTSTGSGTFTSLTVNPGDATITAGNLTVSAGDVDISAGNLTVGGDLTLGGSINLADLTVTSTQPILLETSDNSADAIDIIADGGALEEITIWSKQGTADDSILLRSDAGGVALFSSRASGTADIALTAASGGQVYIHGVLGDVLIEGSGTATDAINLTSGGGIVASSTAKDISFTSTGGSFNVTATESVADAIYLQASGAAGGIILEAGSSGIAIGNQAACPIIDVGDFVPTSSRLITVAGGTVTTAVTDRVDIAVDGVSTSASAVKQVDIASGNVLLGTSTVNINSGTAASGTSTVNISTGTGGGTKAVNIGNADGLTTLNIDAITLINDSLNVNTSINTGTSTGAVAIGNALAGAITIDTAAGISLDGAAASNFSVSGAGIDLTLASAAGRVVVNGEEAAADAVRLLSVAGGLDADFGSTIAFNNSAGNITLASAAGTVLVDAAGVVELNSSAGAISIGNDAVAQAINVGTGAAARTLTIGNTTTTTAVNVNTGTGGFNVASAGIVTIDVATDTQASPTAASTLNVNAGMATFTGFTTASAASQDFTITNSLVSATSSILVSISNEGANDAQMTITRVKRGAGSFVVTAKNNGAAALNGNVSVTFFVLS